jgi:glycosyltransferase involved in cell wall biosynthesis
MRLVVLGMHRSGTSVATGVLELAGAWVGGPAELTKANAENPRGFFERRDVREVCDAILQSHGMDWWRTSASETDFEPDRVRPHLERFADIVDGLDARGTWVIKEPRLCLVLPALLPALDGARFVHVTREPLEVASSLASRNAIPPLAGLALWEQYVRSAVHHTAGRPRTMVRYERLVADPLRTTAELVGSLIELGVDDLVIPSAEALGSLVTGDLHRERASPAERGARFNAIQARLASAVDDETLLDGSWDGGGLSAGARETLAEFEATRDGEQLVAATREALAAERRRADDAERDAEAARRAELDVRSRAGVAVEDVRVRIDAVSRSRPWRVIASVHRARRIVTGATRFDHDHLQMAARELRLLRDSLVPDSETPDPSWAHHERLPSGRILHHSHLPSEPTGRRRIAVLAWDVGHNPLGRAHTMADILRDHAEVSIWGTSFERYGSGLWPPLRGTDIPVHAIRGLDLPELLDALDELARRIDVDAVWVSKPRFPSLALGVLVKRHHGCPLIVDVDDHEQAFFGIDSPLDPASLWDLDRDELRIPYGEAWTRACESVIGHADLLTVSNEVLQQRFGGVVVPHARRPDAFDPALVDRDKIRSELGVADGDRLLLFGGTPRVHKGVLEVLEALDEIGDPRNRLLLFGTRELSELGSDLDRLRRWTLTVPPRSFAELPEVVAAADLSCVLQDPQHPVSRYQVPAKLTDSLAMGVPCVVRAVPPLQPMIDAGVVCNDR